MKTPNFIDGGCPVDGSAEEVRDVFLRGQISEGAAVFLLFEFFGMTRQEAVEFLAETAR